MSLSQTARDPSAPLVSVVIPTHNRPEMLAEALASVRAQTFTNYEIIVVANGESAGTSRHVVGAYGVRYFALPEGNVSAARNFGIGQSHGEWIAFLDDDDVWLPNKLERQVTEALRTGADMIACGYVEFYPNGREILRQQRLIEGWPYVKAISHERWWAAPSAVIVRKSVLNRVGDFDLHLYTGEDNDLWRRISWRHAIHQIDDILVRYRCGHTITKRHQRRAYFYDLRQFYKMRRDTPRDLRWTLPSATAFISPRIARVLLPKWLRQPFHPQRLRRRWMQLRALMAGVAGRLSPMSGSASAGDGHQI